MRAHSVINQEVFVRTHFLCFLRTPPVVIFPKHSFINEAPGPVGFSPEFYKHFWHILSALSLTSEIKQTSQIPPQMKMSLISVLLKPNKDPTNPASCYTLSLINADLKIITKALAIRLQSVISTLIHSDQTGFIKNGHGSDNVQRLFNPVSISQQTQTQTIILSLDCTLQTSPFTILHIKYNILPNGSIKVTTKSHGLTWNSNFVKILNSQNFLF